MTKDEIFAKIEKDIKAYSRNRVKDFETENSENEMCNVLKSLLNSKNDSRFAIGLKIRDVELEAFYMRRTYADKLIMIAEDVKHQDYAYIEDKSRLLRIRSAIISLGNIEDDLSKLKAIIYDYGKGA